MGHASPQAALIYQHATADRDRAIADALSELAGKAAAVVPIRGHEVTAAELGHVQVTSTLSDTPKATRTGSDQPLREHPQRDSNPCLPP